MSTLKRNRNELVDDLLRAEDGEELLSQTGLLALIRREKAARQGRRRMTVRLAACLFLAVAALVVQYYDFSSEPGRQFSSSSPPSVESRPGEVVIKRIGDEELLDLITDQPAALVSFPNGDRELIVLTHWETSTGEW